MEVNYIHYPQTGWGLREYIATQDGIVICSPRAHQNHLASGLFQKDWQYSCACDYHYHVLFIFMGLSLPLSCIVAYSCACHYHYHVLLYIHVPVITIIMDIHVPVITIIIYIHVPVITIIMYYCSFMCLPVPIPSSCISSTGVWIREIRMKTNLGIPQLNKLLKNMMSKKLIKAVKSVAVSSAAWDLFYFCFCSFIYVS